MKMLFLIGNSEYRRQNTEGAFRWAREAWCSGEILKFEMEKNVV